MLKLLQLSVSLPLSIVLLGGTFTGTLHAQLNESIGATPFTVQGNDASPTQSADQFSAERLIEYERQLNSILRTRRVEERAFISQLVAQIEAGAVSTELVQTSFRWVKKKRPLTPFPFLYFERVVRIIATQQGIGDQIPPFDSSVVGMPNPPNQDTAGTDTNGDASIVVE